MENCSTCKFSFIVGMDMGCRRYPPTVMQTVQPDVLRGGTPRMVIQSMSPPTSKNGWCGEYQLKVTE